jgi:hypothetical protein
VSANNWFIPKFWVCLFWNTTTTNFPLRLEIHYLSLLALKNIQCMIMTSTILIHDINNTLTVNFPAGLGVQCWTENTGLSFDFHSNFWSQAYRVDGTNIFLRNFVIHLQDYKFHTYYMWILLLLEKQVGKALELSNKAKLLRITGCTWQKSNFTFSSQRVTSTQVHVVLYSAMLFSCCMINNAAVKRNVKTIGLGFIP